MPARAEAADILADLDMEMPIGWSTQTLSATDRTTAKSDESTLGDAVADAVREQAGADIAIVNGGDLKDDARLPAGNLYQSDIENCFADDRQIAVAEITPKQLYAMLENGVSHIELDWETTDILHEQSAFDGFPQVSGFRFRYDASAPEDTKMQWVKLDDVTLDPDDDTTILTIAASEYFLSGGYDSPPVDSYEVLDLTLSQAFVRYAENGIETNYENEDRMSVIGCSENTIISHIPIVILVLACVVIGMAGFFRQRSRRESGDYNWDETWDRRNFRSW